MPGIFFNNLHLIRTKWRFFFCTRSDLALPERALRRSILQLRTPVRACRLSLAKHARLCDIASDLPWLAVAPGVALNAQQAWGSRCRGGFFLSFFVSEKVFKGSSGDGTINLTMGFALCCGIFWALLSSPLSASLHYAVTSSRAGTPCPGVALAKTDPLAAPRQNTPGCAISLLIYLGWLLAPVVALNAQQAWGSRCRGGFFLSFFVSEKVFKGSSGDGTINLTMGFALCCGIFWALRASLSKRNLPSLSVTYFWRSVSTSLILLTVSAIDILSLLSLGVFLR